MNLSTTLELYAAAKPKCPHCGSSNYVLMPADFETAKCKNCGKNWNHGIVPGINDPYQAQSAGTGSEPADSHVTDEKTKKDSLRKNADAYDKLRRKVGPYGEDRNAKRKPLNPLRKKGLKAKKNDLDPADDLDTERLKQLKKKQQRLCTVCTPGAVPGRNITGRRRI